VIYLALDRLNRKIEKAVPDPGPSGPGPSGPPVAGATEGMQ
jgi:multidrug efflux pump